MCADLIKTADLLSNSLETPILCCFEAVWLSGEICWQYMRLAKIIQRKILVSKIKNHLEEVSFGKSKEKKSRKNKETFNQQKNYKRKNGETHIFYFDPL